MLTLSQDEAENYDKTDFLDEPIDENVEMLHQILTDRHHMTITYVEAAEVGESLIAFFETLAQPKEPENEQR